MATIFMAAFTNYRRDPRVKREAEALVECGHRVVFLACRQLDEPDREIIAHVEVLKTGWSCKKSDTFFQYVRDYVFFSMMITIHLLLHPRCYDLVHINNMPDFLVFATWLQRLLGKPVILDIHDLMPELYMEKFSAGEKHWLIQVLKLQERWSGKFASAVITVEDRLRTILSERGIAPEKISVLMNLPDEKIFVARRPQTEKPPGAPFVIVYHGTLARRLGLDIAIEAISKCATYVPNIELRIIGAGEERQRLIEMRNQLGLQKRVTFSDGYVPVEAIPALIADADVGVIPLRISSGTDIMLPTKLMEYAYCGIPCIAPKTATINRYFDEEMVQFFEAENVTSLISAILTMYNDPAKREALSQQTKKRFVDIYTWGEHKSLYTQLVDKLLSNTRHNAVPL